MGVIWRSWYGRIILILGLLWMVFAMALDIHYGMMARTTLGGLKILGVGWGLAALLYAGFRLVRFLIGKRA